MTALMGTFVKISTMADGTPRIVLDLQCTLSEIADMGLIPGVPFAIARLTKESASAPVAQPNTNPEPAKKKVGELCIMACTFCADPMFWEWAGVLNEPDAKQIILDTCGIASRKELDEDAIAASDFHHHIRMPFMEWKSAQNGVKTQ